MRGLRHPGRWLPLAVLAIVAVVSGVRTVEAFRGELLSGRSERLFYDWAAGDPALEERLAVAAERLPPGVGVRLVVPAGTHVGWATFRGRYHLPQQQVLGIHRAGAAPPPADAWVVDLTAAEPQPIPPAPPLERPGAPADEIGSGGAGLPAVRVPGGGGAEDGATDQLPSSPVQR